MDKELSITERMARISKAALLGASSAKEGESVSREGEGATGGEGEAPGLAPGPEAPGGEAPGGEGEAPGGEAPGVGSGDEEGSRAGNDSEAQEVPFKKRGRHFKDCTCPRCVAKREGSTEETARTPSATPSRVDFSLLFPGVVEAGKKPKIEDSAAGFFLLAGKAAMYLSGSQVWQLSTEEAKDLGRNTVACINTIPAAKKAKLMAHAEGILPWASLALTTIAVVAPRIVAYQMERSSYVIAPGAASSSPGEASSAPGRAPAPSTGKTVTKPDPSIEREPLPFGPVRRA